MARSSNPVNSPSRVTDIPCNVIWRCSMCHVSACCAGITSIAVCSAQMSTCSHRDQAGVSKLRYGMLICRQQQTKKMLQRG